MPDGFKTFKWTERVCVSCKRSWGLLWVAQAWTAGFPPSKWHRCFWHAQLPAGGSSGLPDWLAGWLAEIRREADRRPSSSSHRGLWWLFLPRQEMPQMPNCQIKVSRMRTWPETFPSSESGIQVSVVWVQAVIAMKEAGLDGYLHSSCRLWLWLTLKTKSSCI